MKLIRAVVLGGIVAGRIASAYAASPTVSETVAIVDPATPSQQATVTSSGALKVDASGAGAGAVTISQTTPGTTNGVNINPSNASGIAITPVVSAAAESNHVLCSAACNLWSVYVTSGASAGYLMVFNATSAPGDGAVTPIDCIQVPANASAALTANAGPPDRYSTGATAVFSTTGCFTKTASATAFFKARVAQ